ncbi:MAG: hypothetical protein NZ902_04630 [Acidilobaceae archaeon]|nr:hypothetical protein [Acidilobaceae archaeon]MCX8164986.1 hypothetical protein [Acidilobaceae archaeon]MDW7974497.1 hypothetical protein [Sulfolobales archaeon]
MSTKAEFRELGLCQKCSAPLEYTYVISGPEGEGARVSVYADCSICGHKESKSLVFPIYALYSLRHLFRPNVKLFVERLRLAYELNRVEEMEIRGQP